MSTELVRHGNKRVGPPPVPAKMKLAIAYLLDLEDDVEKAAAHAELKPYLFHCCMCQTRVRRYLNDEREVRIAVARSGNVRALVSIWDDPANKMASVQAIRTLEAMGSDNEQALGAPRQSAGITIVIESGASAKVLRPPIDVGQSRHPIGHRWTNMPNSLIPDFPVTTTSVPRQNLSKSDIASPMRAAERRAVSAIESVSRG